MVPFLAGETFAASTHATYTWCMSQLTIYLPEELVREVRRRARKKGRSVSAYLAELARNDAAMSTWPEAFVATFGSWEGEPPIIEEQRFERRKRLR